MPIIRNARTVCTSDQVKRVEKRFIEADQLFFAANDFYNNLPQQIQIRVSPDKRLPPPTYAKVSLESYRLNNYKTSEKKRTLPLENTQCSTSPSSCDACNTQKKVVPPSAQWSIEQVTSVPETVTPWVSIVVKWEALPPDQQPRKTKVLTNPYTGRTIVVYLTPLPFVPPGQGTKVIRYNQKMNIEQRFETTFYRTPFETEQLCMSSCVY